MRKKLTWTLLVFAAGAGASAAMRAPSKAYSNKARLDAMAGQAAITAQATTANTTDTAAIITALNGVSFNPPMAVPPGYPWDGVLAGSPGLGATPGGTNAAWYAAVAAAIGGLYNAYHTLAPGCDQMFAEMEGRGMFT